MGAEDLRSECNTRGLRLYFFKIDFIKSTIHSSAVKYCISIYNIQSNAPASFFATSRYVASRLGCQPVLSLARTSAPSILIAFIGLYRKMWEL